jgi:nucleoid-associated protein YgaU
VSITIQDAGANAALYKPYAAADGGAGNADNEMSLNEFAQMAKTNPDNALKFIQEYVDQPEMQDFIAKFVDVNKGSPAVLKALANLKTEVGFTYVFGKDSPLFAKCDDAAKTFFNQCIAERTATALPQDDAYLRFVEDQKKAMIFGNTPQDVIQEGDVKFHTVKEGDTGNSLAKKYYGAEQYGLLLLYFNGISDEKELPLNKTLEIPDLQTLKKYQTLLSKEVARADYTNNCSIVRASLSALKLPVTDPDYKAITTRVAAIEKMLQGNFNGPTVEKELQTVAQLLTLRRIIDNCRGALARYDDVCAMGTALEVKDLPLKSFDLPASAVSLIGNPDAGFAKLTGIQAEVEQLTLTIEDLIKPALIKQNPVIGIRDDIYRQIDIVNDQSRPLAERESAFKKLLDKYEELTKTCCDQGVGAAAYNLFAKAKDGIQVWNDKSLSEIKELRKVFLNTADKAAFLNNRVYSSALSIIDKRAAIVEFVKMLREESGKLMKFGSDYLLSFGRAVFQPDKRRQTVTETSLVVSEYMKIFDQLCSPKTANGVTLVGPQLPEDFEALMTSDKFDVALGAYQKITDQYKDKINELLTRAVKEPQQFPNKWDVVGICTGMFGASLLRLGLTRLGVSAATAGGRIALSAGNALGFLLGSRITTGLLRWQSPYSTDSVGSFASDFAFDFASTWLMFKAFNVGAKGWEGLAGLAKISKGTVQYTLGELATSYVLFVGAETLLRSGKNLTEGKPGLTLPEFGNIMKDSALMLGMMKVAGLLLGPELGKIEDKITRGQIELINKKVADYARTVPAGDDPRVKTIAVLQYKIELYQEFLKTNQNPAVKSYFNELKKGYAAVSDPTKVNKDILAKTKDRLQLTITQTPVRKKTVTYELPVEDITQMTEAEIKKKFADLSPVKLAPLLQLRNDFPAMEKEIRTNVSDKILQEVLIAFVKNYTANNSVRNLLMTPRGRLFLFKALQDIKTAYDNPSSFDIVTRQEQAIREKPIIDDLLFIDRSKEFNIDQNGSEKLALFVKERISAVPEFQGRVDQKTGLIERIKMRSSYFWINMQQNTFLK